MNGGIQPIPYPLTGIVTLVGILVYFWMATQVARTRVKVGILAPVMTGDDRLERTIRAHLNMLEWMPIFLPSLWLFAIYWDDKAAAVLGGIWVLGRIIYFLGYVRAPRGRLPGFFIQAFAVAVLVLGALGRAAWAFVASG